LELSENALYVLKQRYLRKNEHGEIIETPEQMFHRVAHAISSVEAKYGKTKQQIQQLEVQFYELMTSLKFLPNSPTLMNAGTDLSLSACFVLPIDDDIHSIMDGAKYAAIVHKAGGGTGFSFSRIRPKGDVVKTTGGIASGPISFMKIYDATTETIKQGGRRRGANIAILRIDHPDITRFIHCKETEGRFANFNLSVGITDKFMKAVEKDKDFQLVNPRTGKVVREEPARILWNLILHYAWINGEPAMVFLDTINKYNQTPELGEIESTNPCGEMPLLPYESCNLGSINLSKFISDGRIQWKELEETVKLTIQFLDDVIDANHYPLMKIDVATKANRKIGLGVMGWADLLIKKGVKYSSEEAINLAKKLMKFITDTARQMSRELGKERGNFPNKHKSIWKDEKYMRNATVTTIAPTGSIGVIGNCSGGIEPIFDVVYRRNVEDSIGKTLEELNSVIKELGYDINNLPKHVEIAREITPLQHVRMQATFQKYVDNAVSKTVNLPNGATIRDVEQVFLEAYRTGCKGVAVYRDGSRNYQLLTSIEASECKGKICPI